MPIKVLDPKVVSRIAAGEVVERPASVVKELVENSLDAGSSQVSIEVEGGGISLIRVIDDGSGILPAELGLAFERYATSKIDNLSDLESISSLGFRGEALPSIAAVAEVGITTCAKGEQAGSYLTLKDGVTVKKGSYGRPQGTTVTVRNLFRKLPARLKFLKSAVTENSHIASTVSQYALAFPEVKFNLVIDARPSLRTPGSGKLLDSIAQVYGLEIAQNMLEVKGLGEGSESLGPQVTGMVGTPEVSRSSRSYLSFFVNRRPVNSRLLIWAVEEAYHGLLMTGKHPVAIINLALSPSRVDVNVHPTKLEVKFQDERLVFGTVQKAVRQTLISGMPVSKVGEVKAKFVTMPQPRQIVWTETGTIERRRLSGRVSPTPKISLPVLRILGQFEGAYIVAEGPDGLYLIDQHAAHERILFEKIKQQRSQQKMEVQGLLEPVTFEVSPQQAETLKLYANHLAEFGFAIESFGDRTYLVRSVPALVDQKDWAMVLRELLDSLAEESSLDLGEKIAISLACHGAVRAGQGLTDDEMRQLLRTLEQVTIPNTCPHGRPTMIYLSTRQLKKEFGRV